MNEHTEEPTAAEERRLANHPVERNAALLLAAAQRDLALALASSPEAIAAEEGLADPEAAYRGWVQMMTESERAAREWAAAAVVAGYEYDNRAGTTRRPRDPVLAALADASITRARVAIAAMTGLDTDAAAAAREDVLRRWAADERAARAALTGRGRDEIGEA